MCQYRRAGAFNLTGESLCLLIKTSARMNCVEDFKDWSLELATRSFTDAEVQWVHQPFSNGLWLTAQVICLHCALHQSQRLKAYIYYEWRRKKMEKVLEKKNPNYFWSFNGRESRLLFKPGNRRRRWQRILSPGVRLSWTHDIKWSICLKTSVVRKQSEQHVLLLHRRKNKSTLQAPRNQRLRWLWGCVHC